MDRKLLHDTDIELLARTDKDTLFTVCRDLINYLHEEGMYLIDNEDYEEHHNALITIHMILNYMQMVENEDTTILDYDKTDFVPIDISSEEYFGRERIADIIAFYLCLVDVDGRICVNVKDTEYCYPVNENFINEISKN